MIRLIRILVSICAVGAIRPVENTVQTDTVITPKSVSFNLQANTPPTSSLLHSSWCFSRKMASQDDQNMQLLDFTCNLYRSVFTHKEGSNVILSPLSISMALGMTLRASDGNSAKELARCLGNAEADRETIHETFASYLKSLQQSSESTSLFLVNYVFPDVKFSVLPAFSESMRCFYNATVQSLNFQSNAEESRQYINTCIFESTHEKIKDMLPSDAVTRSTRMILVNAVYFKSLWAAKFNPKLTHHRSFHINKDKIVLVPMMHQQSKFMLGMNEELQCSVLELPYVGDNLSLFILLPLDVEGLSFLEKNLNSAKLCDLMSNLSRVKVSIFLPRFKLEEQLSLKPILEELGVKDIFDASTADLSMMSSESGLYVSAVEHKAVIEVNEEGTEAAAATHVGINKRSLEIVEEFKADKPFMFLLIEKTRNVILFIGAYKQPMEDETPTAHEEL